MKNHNAILNHLRQNETATLAELYQISPFGYYCNWQKHFGQVMSRLVKQGLVERVKPGVFKLGSKPKPKGEITEVENQCKLF